MSHLPLCIAPRSFVSGWLLRKSVVQSKPGTGTGTANQEPVDSCCLCDRNKLMAPSIRVVSPCDVLSSVSPNSVTTTLQASSSRPTTSCSTSNLNFGCHSIDVSLQLIDLMIVHLCQSFIRILYRCECFTAFVKHCQFAPE